MKHTKLLVALLLSFSAAGFTYAQDEKPATPPDTEQSAPAPDKYEGFPKATKPEPVAEAPKVVDSPKTAELKKRLASLRKDEDEARAQDTELQKKLSGLESEYVAETKGKKRDDVINELAIKLRDGRNERHELINKLSKLYQEDSAIQQELAGVPASAAPAADAKETPASTEAKPAAKSSKKKK
jgi:hypothetical protein